MVTDEDLARDNVLPAIERLPEIARTVAVAVVASAAANVTTSASGLSGTGSCSSAISGLGSNGSTAAGRSNALAYGAALACIDGLQFVAK